MEEAQDRLNAPQKEVGMPEIFDHGSGSEKNDTHGGNKKLGLLESLKQAHALDHEILDSLGIKHPHIPILSVIEMLDHLRNKHAGDSQERSPQGPEKRGAVSKAPDPE